MSQRSPYNDRYKVEQKGKTRKSASAAKPRRALADLTPGEDTSKKSAPKRRWWQSSSFGATSKAQPIPWSPAMRKLRRVWWILWGASLALAAGILLIEQAIQHGDAALKPYVPFAWAIWLACMAGAFYLEFVPLRKARLAAVESARSSEKSGKKRPDDKGTGA